MDNAVMRNAFNDWDSQNLSHIRSEQIEEENELLRPRPHLPKDDRVISWGTQLELTTNAYERDFPEHMNPKFRATKARNLLELFQVIDHAITEHKLSIKRPESRILRWLGQNTDTARAFSSLLPNDSYGSILCGGLQIVFNAAAQIEEKRIEVLDCLQEVPVLMAEVCWDVDLYKCHEELKPLAGSFYISAVRAVNHMIKWLLSRKRDTFRKFAKAIVGRRDDLTDLISNIHADIKRIRDEVKRIDQKTLQHLGTTSTSQAKSLSRVEKRFADTDRRWEDWVQGDAEFKKAVELRLQVNAQKKAERQAYSQLAYSLLDVIYQSSQMAHQKEVSIQLSLEKQHSWILSHFTAIPDQVDEDRENIDREAQSSETAVIKNKTTWLMQNQRFAVWVSSPATARLLIQDGSDDNAVYHHHIAASSFFCTGVIEFLAHREDIIVIGFFCSLHNNQKDSLAGPRGMLRLLIAQLLLSDAGRKLSYDDVTQPVLNAIAEQDIYALCEFLRWFLAQLPLGTTIFCLIDGIAEFDSHAWRSDMIYALQQLCILSQTSQKASLKLLFTNWSNLSAHIHQLMGDFTVIHVPDGLAQDAASFVPIGHYHHDQAYGAEPPPPPKLELQDWMDW